jgi:hypothetical protein
MESAACEELIRRDPTDIPCNPKALLLSKNQTLEAARPPPPGGGSLKTKGIADPIFETKGDRVAVFENEGLI